MKRILFAIIIATIIVGAYNYKTDKKSEASLTNYVDSRGSSLKEDIESSESVFNVLNPVYSYKSYVALFDVIVLYVEQIKTAITEKETKDKVSFWAKIKITFETIFSREQKNKEVMSANQVLSLFIPIILIIFIIRSFLSFNLFQRAPMLDEYYEQFEEEDAEYDEDEDDEDEEDDEEETKKD